MVDGVNGVGNNSMSAAEIKAYVQELVEETLATKEAQAASEVTEESADEESGVISEETTQQEAAVQSNDVENPLTGFMTSITTLFDTLLQALLQVVGAGKTEGTGAAGEADDAAGSANTGNEKYVMTEDEKAYLTLHPDFVRNLVAQEKVADEDSSSNKVIGGSKLKQAINEVKVKLTAQKVTDEEIQAYLQLHPNVIKDAIAKERA